MLAGELSRVEPDKRNSMRFELERLRPARDKAIAEGKDASGYERNMKGALLRAFDGDVRREAARWLAESGL